MDLVTDSLGQSIHYNPSIKSDKGQHSQFLRCFSGYKLPNWLLPTCKKQSMAITFSSSNKTDSGLKMIPAEQMKGIVGEFTREHSAWIVWLPIPSLHECKHQRVSLKGIGDKCFAFQSKGIPPRRGPIVKLGRDVDLIEVNPANANATNSTVRVPDFLTSRSSRTG